MALIELHPDLKELTRHAKRIADALERLLVEAYAVRIGDTLTPAPSASSDEPEVSYSEDEATFRKELLDLYHGRNPDRVIDDEDGG